jgi:hypothetical protein
METSGSMREMKVKIDFFKPEYCPTVHSYEEYVGLVGFYDACDPRHWSFWDELSFILHGGLNV